jgi:hypothetical protein
VRHAEAEHIGSSGWRDHTEAFDVAFVSEALATTLKPENPRGEECVDAGLWLS